LSSKPNLWIVGKVLEGIGMVVVLVGLVMAITLGLDEEGLKSMSVELGALGIGGGIFFLGYLLERGQRK